MTRKKNQIILEKVEVIDIGSKGRAIAKLENGKKLFIENAVPGDICDVQVFKKRRSYLEGKAICFHELSSDRVEPVCEHFGTCGGCKWQQLDYAQQLIYKQSSVAKSFLNELSSEIKLPEISPIVGSAKQYLYRNKLEYSFSANRWIPKEELELEIEDRDRDALGFHIQGMWEKVLDINHCHLQEQPSNQIRLAVKKFAKDNGLPFYNLRYQSGLLRNLMIRTTSTQEVMAIFQFFEDDTENIKKLLDYVIDGFPNLTSLMYVINKKSNDSFFDQDVILYHGRDYLIEEIEDLKFRIRPKSFFQVNAIQACELYKVARSFAQISRQDVVYDLYTGIGTIAQFVARQAKKVVGIESIPQAIEDAKENAEVNQLDNVDFFVGDIKDLLNDAFIQAHGLPQVVITDPPRVGMHKDVVQKLLEIAAPRIVYVSCNPDSQAKDLALLCEKYDVTRVQPVDMFPQTPHVENVVLLELKA
ncbi:23S rRNA (uracil(1939)-C(5))-methyltransferase RlmD [Tumidithrix elongata RA019]|uniref:23S rRNA (Uracil(1939)-C(5))-methyltransferase RlmD n=1 Tax=Tumidithrix elongata BACA0141 TaxID=2716417 RepID=A0AAW9PY89_9CYAN|nr:23S rRNA (uracil(1939)-C(5))-methyltransferase RlmD [Tumidithrix elongata RA019]